MTSSLIAFLSNYRLAQTHVKTLLCVEAKDYEKQCDVNCHRTKACHMGHPTESHRLDVRLTALSHGSIRVCQRFFSLPMSFFLLFFFFIVYLTLFFYLCFFLFLSSFYSILNLILFFTVFLSSSRLIRYSYRIFVLFTHFSPVFVPFYHSTIFSFFSFSVLYFYFFVIC